VAAFDYVALDAKGGQKKGTLEADSSRQARQLLRDMGLMPLSMDESAKSLKNKSKSSISFFSPSLSTSDLALITRQLSTLIQSSLPIEEALTTVAQQSEDPKVSSIMSAVRSKVLEGHPLASAMAEFPRAFDQLYRATISAGEHSGHLDLVMERLADHTESSQEFSQTVKMAMIYPIILLLMAVGVVVGLMTFVVPKIIKVFAGSGQELPFLTRALVSASEFIGSYGFLVVILLSAATAAFIYAMQQKAFRMRVHKRMLHMPFFKKLVRGFNAARYASTLSILSSSGVPLVEGMKIASQVLSNDFMRLKLNEATTRVSEGTSLNKALAESRYFPPMMLHMIASGEASGQLDSMLERTAKHQERDLKSLITMIVGLFEPFMLVFMGVSVLMIVMAILMPIIDMNDLVM
tara:strand:+ start:391 stop:1611 length:1221 start_codon:yes stop_codon:yes gene_type:complete